MMAEELVAKRYPYFKFYPSDWRGDPALRLCSLEERGLWIEMLALMHEAEPYGHLIVKGTPIDAQQLAGLVGITQNLAKKLLKNLENFGVFSRTSEGIIFSRKMVRDFESRAKSKGFGSLGGNPSLKGVNPPDNPRLKPQSPESIVQSPDNNCLPNGKQSSADDAADQTGPKFSRKPDPEKIALLIAIGEQWNQLAQAHGLATINAIEKDRERSCLARAKELTATYEFETAADGFSELFEKVRASPFLRGDAKPRNGASPFRASFDWVMAPGNFRKIMENTYG